ncbi:MAG: hypothetical protein IJ600_09490, partial [Lachnospiraceae bacterium]|nr:hypothetical protein [Lachnospiraceae bacterium]
MDRKERYEENMRRKVLVVDDEDVNRQLLGYILSREYDVIYAENGKQAQALIRDNKRKLSMVMLDLL